MPRKKKVVDDVESLLSKLPADKQDEVRRVLGTPEQRKAIEDSGRPLIPAQDQHEKELRDRAAHGLEETVPEDTGPLNTRQLSLSCPVCGYTVRTTRKWMRTGMPTCSCGTMMIPQNPERLPPSVLRHIRMSAGYGHAMLKAKWRKIMEALMLTDPLSEKYKQLKADLNRIEEEMQK